MKRLLLFLFPVFLTSCAFPITRAVTVRSTEDNSDTLSAGDSNLVYAISLKGGVPEFTLYNRSHQNLTIDWQRSSLVANGTSTPYYNPTAVFTTTYNYQAYHYNGTRTATTVRYEDVPFTSIPPGSSVVVKKDLGLWTLPDFEKINSFNDSLFTPESSPVKYQHYISYYVADSSNIHHNLVQNSYVSQVQVVHGTTAQQNPPKTRFVNQFTLAETHGSEGKDNSGLLIACVCVGIFVMLMLAHG